MKYLTKKLSDSLATGLVLAALVSGLIASSMTRRVQSQVSQQAGAPVSAGPVVIDFENISTGGPGGASSPVTVTNQYQDRGIIFNSPVALDYSSGLLAIPGFAHSGVRAVEQCYGAEFCAKPFEMSFTRAQRRIKVWIGYSA